MKHKNRIVTPTKTLIKEMYVNGYISEILYKNGGVNLDLILLYTHEIIIVDQDPEIDFENERCDRVTIHEQIKAYCKLIDGFNKHGFDPQFEPIVEGYRHQLSRLRNLRLLLASHHN